MDSYKNNESRTTDGWGLRRHFLLRLPFIH